MTAGSPPVLAAALIRAAIRAAVHDGTLGELPPGISFSVSASTLATAPGVRVTVYGDGEWVFTGPDREHLTPECDALRRKLLEIAGRHWQPPVPGGFTDVQVNGRQRDILDVIEQEVAGITDAHIEERLQETLRRTGYAHGNISGHPKRKD